MGVIPFGLLEPPQANGPDTADSQVKQGQLSPRAKAPRYTFFSGNEKL